MLSKEILEKIKVIERKLVSGDMDFLTNVIEGFVFSVQEKNGIFIYQCIPVNIDGDIRWLDSEDELTEDTLLSVYWTTDEFEYEEWMEEGVKDFEETYNDLLEYLSNLDKKLEMISYYGISEFADEEHMRLSELVDFIYENLDI
jgi:hypothetical protein